MKMFFISNESSKSHETLIFVQTLQKKKPKVNANVKDRIENLFYGTYFCILAFRCFCIRVNVYLNAFLSMFLSFVCIVIFGWV